MMHRIHGRARTLGLLLLMAGPPMLAACGGEEPEPVAAEPFVLPDIEEDPVVADFVVEIDAADPILDGEHRQPLAQPVTITGGNEGLGLMAYVKRPPGRADGVWVELLVENLGTDALREVTVTHGAVQGAGSVIDVTNAPFAEAPTSGSIPLGGIAAEGVGRVAVFLPGASNTVRLDVSVTGTPTNRHARNSAPIDITPDGSEVWAAFADGDVVAVIDTSTQERVAEVAVDAAPASVAVSPDGAHVLVASRLGNSITVIDRERREVIQTLGEEEGVPRELRHLVVAPEGTYAYASSYVDDQVVRLLRRGDEYELDGTAEVGRRPAGIAISPDGLTLLAAHYLPRGDIRHNEAWVSVIDTESMTLRDEVVIHDELNVDRVHCLADVFGISPSRMTMEGAASALAGAFYSPSGTTAWVPGMRVSPGPVLELGPDHADLGSFTDGPLGRFAPAFLFMLDGHLGSEVDALRASSMLDIPDAIPEYIRCVDAQTDIEFTTREVLEGSTEQINSGVANPNGFAGLDAQGRIDFLAFTRGSRRTLGLSAMADELVVYDATTLHPSTQRHFLLSGSNPIGMVLSPDGSTGYVSYRNSTHVSVLDLTAYAGPQLPDPSYVPFRFVDLEDRGAAPAIPTQLYLTRDVADVPELPSISEIGRVELVDADPLDPSLRRGRVLFESSNPDRWPELSASRQASCATCHPGGGSDGSAWATVEGERRTMSLRGGVGGRGWLHASASHRDTTDFAGVVVEQRLGGATTPETVSAMAEFVAFGLPELQRPRVDEDLAQRGETLFAAHCRSCHADETFGSGNPDPSHPLGGGAESGPVLFDVGTHTDSAGVLFASFFESLFPPEQAEMLDLMRGDRDLGPDDPLIDLLDFEPRPERPAGSFKAPSLVNVWDQAVFFHDGRFSDLRDVVLYFDDHLALGLGDDDVDALVEYLKTL